MDNTIRKIAAAIKDHYVDKQKAADVAQNLLAFIGSPGWERYILTNNTSRLIWNLNCIITNTADDGHFFISTSSRAQSSAGTGIDRFTPHYIKINDFVHLNDENVRIQYSKVFAQIQDPLIIDVRDCPGGNPETAYFILSHLLADDTPLFELITRTTEPRIFKSTSVLPFYSTYNAIKKFTGRVRILVNGNTASAAESLAFILQNHKRATIYGSRTATHAHITMGLPIDTLVAHIPFAKTVDPETKKDWEGVGIVPDYDIVSKEFIDLIYNELSTNYLTPSQGHDINKDAANAQKKTHSNPFTPPQFNNKF